LEDILTMLLAALAVLGLVYLLVGPVMRLYQRYDMGVVTVMDGEAALRFVRGELAGVVGPGRYATWPQPVSLERIDLREQTMLLSGQEVYTRDALTLRVSLTLRFKVTSPLAWRRGAVSMNTRLYEDAHAALRTRVAAASLDDILADRDRIVLGMAEELTARYAENGAIVLAVIVRDLVLSGPARSALADLWKAEKEGKAALERARAEQASLRALANAARVLKNNPELMNLRTLQALQTTPGKPAPTIVLGGAQGLLPVGRGGDAAGVPEPPDDT
jgi:regulator of protease activity HflC (stomatin/prohibitin superfamily)